MFYIRTVPPDEAEGPLKDIYDNDVKRMGFVPTYTQAFSLRPDVLQAYANLMLTIHKHLRLRRYELVTLAAATLMHCRP